MRKVVRGGGLSVVHDVSDGGLACALAECAIAGGIGLEVNLGELIAGRGGEVEDWLFGEGPGGFVVAGDDSEVRKLIADGLAVRLGTAGGEVISIEAGDVALDVTVADAAAAWRSLGALLEPPLPPATV